MTTATLLCPSCSRSFLTESWTFGDPVAAGESCPYCSTLTGSARVRVGEPSTTGAEAALSWAADRREAAGDAENAAIYRKVRDQSTGDLAAAALDAAVRRGVEVRASELRDPWPDLDDFVRGTRDTTRTDPSSVLADLLGIVGVHIRGRVVDAFESMDAVAFATIFAAICKPTARVDVDQNKVREAVERFARSTSPPPPVPVPRSKASTVAELAEVLADASTFADVEVDGDNVDDVEAVGSRITVTTASGWRFAFDVVPVGAVNVRTRPSRFDFRTPPLAYSTIGGVVSSHWLARYFDAPDQDAVELGPPCSTCNGYGSDDGLPCGTPARDFGPDAPGPCRDCDGTGNACLDEEDPIGEGLDRKVDELAQSYRDAGENMAGYDFAADDLTFDAARESSKAGGRSHD